MIACPTGFARLGRPNAGAAGHEFLELPIYGPDVTDPTTQPSFSPSGRYVVAALVTDDQESGMGAWSGDSSGARVLASYKAPFAGAPDFTLHGIKYVETDDKGHVVLDTSSYMTGTSTEKDLLLRYTPGAGWTVSN
jgi:hypothetical protein